jgi:HEAT repeat protein
VLNDKDLSLRYQAIRLAGTLGKDESAVVPALLALCTEDNAEIRLAAIQELGQLGPYAQEASDKLRKISESDARASVREAAAAAVKKIEGK